MTGLRDGTEDVPPFTSAVKRKAAPVSHLLLYPCQNASPVLLPESVWKQICHHDDKNRMGISIQELLLCSRTTWAHNSSPQVSENTFENPALHKQSSNRTGPQFSSNCNCVISAPQCLALKMQDYYGAFPLAAPAHSSPLPALTSAQHLLPFPLVLCRSV